MPALTTDQRYQLAVPRVTADEFDGEYVVLDLEKFRYYSFSSGAAIVWDALTSGYTVIELIGQVTNEQVRANITEFAEQLVQACLISPATEPLSPTPSALAAITAELQQPELTFHFDAFDDLAELLAADPIHDVEREVGWPHQKPVTK